MKNILHSPTNIPSKPGRFAPANADQAAASTWLVTGIACALVVTPMAASATTVENAVDPTGVSGFVDLAYGDHTVNSSIGTGIEVDSYRFHGAAGDAVRVIVSTQSSGLDPEIVLRDPSGAVLTTSACSGSFSGSGVRCSSNIDASLIDTGVFYINLSDQGSNEAGSYTLHLDRYPPVNNWDGLAYATPVAASIDHLGDMDFFAFSGNASTEVRVSLASTSSGIDPLLEIWDPSGNAIVSEACNGSFSGSGVTCAVTPFLSLTDTGIYRIGISDSGWNETGQYTLGVSCLFGDCPTQAPIPTPIPAGIWLFGSGLLGLLGIGRRVTV